MKVEVLISKEIDLVKLYAELRKTMSEKYEETDFGQTAVSEPTKWIEEMSNLKSRTGLMKSLHTFRPGSCKLNRTGQSSYRSQFVPVRVRTGLSSYRSHEITSYFQTGLL